MKIAIPAILSLFIMAAASCGTSNGGGELLSLTEAVKALQDKPASIEKIREEILEEERLLHDATLQGDIDRGLLILINRANTVGSDYAPEDLERVKYVAKNRSEVGWTMRHEAAEAFNALSEAAAAEGHEIVVTTAYRSYGFQSTLYNNYVANYGQAEADTFSARPGTSEHQSGLAADVSSPSVAYRLERTYNEYPEGAWLKEHAHEYGFIIRFPPGREGITGYIYEPWHIRYVGLTAAKEIYEQDTTLEEYVAALKAGGAFVL